MQNAIAAVPQTQFKQHLQDITACQLLIQLAVLHLHCLAEAVDKRQSNCTQQLHNLMLLVGQFVDWRSLQKLATVQQPCTHSLAVLFREVDIIIFVFVDSLFGVHLAQERF